MSGLLPELDDPALDRLRQTLSRLARRPPQVLLLEGGDEAQRLAMARFWAAACNCQQPSAPCLVCPVCTQIAAGEYLDCLAYDGRISNRDDEESPGLTRAFNMDNIRTLKALLRDAPHGPGRRTVILMGLGQKRDGAANALLKVLEEPPPHTVFCLLAAQREQLLPTLVSRSFCLTLPWPVRHQSSAALAQWEDALAAFLQNGQGLLDKTSARNALDAPLSGEILVACQRSLARVLAGQSNGPLDAALASLDTPALAQCGRWLEEAHDMLRYSVTPARVLEALAARLFVLRRGQGLH